jgi:chemotaxis protein CheD
MLETAHDSIARNTYFDRLLAKEAAKLLPGEYYVTQDDMVLVTVLGSCVAACIRDVSNGIGGMNHFMLPDSGTDSGRLGGAARYGVHAMEMLINSLLKMGARRQNFEAKVFGGGNVMRSLNHSQVGQRNAEFVLEFLANEKIRVAARDLEDVHPRKVYFFPHSGLVRVKKLRELANTTVFAREADYGSRIKAQDKGGDIELFG